MGKEAINVVVVGLGFGQLHCDLIRKTPGLKLWGVCDLDLSRMSEYARRMNVKGYSHYRQVLDDPEVKLVVIVTPHSEHRVLAVAGMNAKKHVVVEKPMCLNPREADAMLRARDKNGVMLSVHHNRRFDRDFQTLTKVLNQGVLGKAFLIEERIHFYGPWQGWRREHKFGGGLINDWGAHLVDQLLLLNAGAKVTHIFATFQYQVFKTDVENHASVRLQFSNGNEGLAEVSQLCGTPLPRWLVVGEKGSLVLDPGKWGTDEDEHRFELHTRKGNGDLRSQIPLVKSGWHLYYQNIAGHLLWGKALSVRPEQARRSVAVIDAAHRSAASKRVVRVENV